MIDKHRSPRNITLLQIVSDLGLLVFICFVTGFLVFSMPDSPFRPVFAFFCLFFLPGYSFQIAIFPEKRAASKGYFLSLSFGLSIIISGLIFLIVSFSIGLDILTSFYSIFIWNISLSFIAFLRRMKRVYDNSVYLPSTRNSTGLSWCRKLTNEVAVSQIAVLVLVMLSALYLLNASQAGSPQYVEFYLLGENELAGNYPTQLFGEPVSLTVVVVNHGSQNLYDLYYQYDNGEKVYLSSAVLSDDEKWEYLVSLTPEISTTKISLNLVKRGEEVPIHSLHIWMKEE